MHSSTSSFERPLVNMRWLPIWVVVFLIFISSVIGIEARLASIGITATSNDSQEKWQTERARASQLGSKALILIGASRIQLGVDLDALRIGTGLEPVQLAIDGSSPMPVLASLANDPKVLGTIVVDYYDHLIGSYDGPAEKYQRSFDEGGIDKRKLAPYLQSEKFLTEWVREHLASYADGANPFHSLMRILDDDGSRSPITTRPDRSRLGDYTRVKMPDYYHSRVARNLGISLPTFDKNAEPILRRHIFQLKASNNDDFIRSAILVKQLVAKIEGRGGRVLFLTMPSSGMVREIEERRFPTEKFWNIFIETTGITAVRSADHDLLKNFTCPDGSHLDYRDRTRFTIAMIQALGIGDAQRNASK